MADIFSSHTTDRPTTADPRSAAAQALYERSGRVETVDPLVSFLYDLVRDHLPAGVVERLAVNAVAPVTLTNGWLAGYAADVAARLRAPAGGRGGAV